MNEKILLTGNEAIARGVWEAGGHLVVAYPGTPSTEITENAAKYLELSAQWAPNEKVALETGIGCSIAGKRVLVAMKHVGLNVAADPLFTAAYTGVNGGLVIVSADDPGIHSSQNEQDNRHYGRAAKVPVLEPSDSKEAKNFTKLAFVLSEQFDVPVILRLTTRVAHSQSLVELSPREELPLKGYVKDAGKYVMVPAHAKKRHVILENKLLELAKFSDQNKELNHILWQNRKMGIVASGAVYQYVREALPDVSVLKIGMSFPLPEKLIKEFAAGVEKLFVVEELEPFMENAIKAMGIEVAGSEMFPRVGEIFTEDIRAKLGDATARPILPATGIPVRPPVLCPGCPHRAVFYVLHKLKLNVSGDIGCYTLGFMPPLSAIDTTICMGASISVAHGMEVAQGREMAAKTVAVIGDSTFIHSGITSLINTVYNGGSSTILILDNSITAMTGHQHNPATGFDAKGNPAPKLSLAALVRACGVNRVQIVDAFDLKKLQAALKEELAVCEPSVIIVERACALIDKSSRQPALVANQEKCNGCGLCLALGCPCLIKKVDGKVEVDAAQCVGCGLCAALCQRGALEKTGDEQ